MPVTSGDSATGKIRRPEAMPAVSAGYLARVRRLVRIGKDSPEYPIRDCPKISYFSGFDGRRFPLLPG